jgi:hypothetical protein
VDDNAAPAEILFPEWVTLTERYGVISRERRSLGTPEIWRGMVSYANITSAVSGRFFAVNRFPAGSKSRICSTASCVFILTEAASNASRDYASLCGIAVAAKAITQSTNCVAVFTFVLPRHDYPQADNIDSRESCGNPK